MTSWLLVSLAIVSRDDHFLNFSATMALIIGAGIFSHCCCGVLMCTARTEWTTLEDWPELKSLSGRPILGTYLLSPRAAEFQTSVRIFEVLL